MMRIIVLALMLTSYFAGLAPQPAVAQGESEVHYLRANPYQWIITPYRENSMVN